MVLKEYAPYHRENTLKKKTLRVLQEYKIIIFVANNPFFMKPRRTDNSHIIGFMTGVINNPKDEFRTIDDKEDYERIIRYYLKYY